MIDHFTREQFEAALPRHKETGSPLWRRMGIWDGEEQYNLPVCNGLEVTIRSSVDYTGQAASTGEDSIRCWLIDPNRDDKPMAPKVARWITRVKGWEKRMQDTLRYLYKISKMLTPCPKCGVLRSARRVKKEGPYKGFLFQTCDKCPNTLEWFPREFDK